MSSLGTLTLRIKTRPRFPLGKVAVTSQAMSFLEDRYLTPLEYILRHQFCDWGDLPVEDVQSNERALTDGGRLISAYEIEQGKQLYVITEADRSSTTLLMSEEY